MMPETSVISLIIILVITQVKFREKIVAGEGTGMKFIRRCIPMSSEYHFHR